MACDSPHDPFTPTELIDISSTCGHIGRFYWCNPMQITIESWGDDGYIDRATQELPGSCAWINSMGDWWAWVWS
jgi:hypothetical protein